MPMKRRSLSSMRAARRALLLLVAVTAATSLCCGSQSFAQAADDQAAFRNYKQLCSQVRRGTWEMRTTLCGMLDDDEAIVKMMISAQVRDVCGSIDKECPSANEDGRARMKFFASALKCPAGPSVCTKETARPTLIDARATGTIPALKQPTDMTCWATVATMMYSWKTNRSESISSALGKVGATYLEMFKANQGLPGADKPGFLASMGLKAEAPQNYTAEGWASLIRRHGPLWVTTEGAAKFSVHARVMSAIFGDGSASGTTVVVYDPADGRVHTETLGAFVRKFEDVARRDGARGGDLRPQVVHY